MRPILYGQLDRLATDRWAWHSLRRLLRSFWLGASVCCVWLGGSLVWDWPVRLEWLGAAMLACVGAALLTMLRPPMRPAEAARRLDQRFGLNEQLATAVEIAATNPPQGTVGAHLLQHATRTSRGLRQQIRTRQRLPWTDVLTLVAIVLALIGLLLISGVGAPLLAGLPSPLPPLPRSADPADLFPEPPADPTEAQPGMGEGDQMAPGEGQQSMPGEGEQAGPGEQGADQSGAGSQQAAGADPRTMQELADALRDQGATRPAAEALDRGDAAGAAQELRELADQAGQLSDEARGDLADNLREAARDIERTDREMAEQLRDSARDLEGSGSQPSQALDDLADALDRSASGQGDPLGPQQAGGEQPGEGPGASGEGSAGQDGQGQGQGGAGNASAGQQRPVQPERLGVDGRPVELETEGGGQQGGDQARPNTTTPGGTGGTAGGDPQDMGASGPDPLRIPLDERDVVQEYFDSE